MKQHHPNIKNYKEKNNERGREIGRKERKGKEDIVSSVPDYQ